MPSRREVLPLCCLLLSLGFACDELTSNPASDPVVKSELAEATPLAEPEPPADPPPAEPEPAPPTGGPSCDQRELIADGAGGARSLCVDYSDHRGPSEPRCFEGVELGEGPCPSEGVVASCTLRATGVTMLHYEGADLDGARRDCEAIQAVFALSDSRRGG